MARKRPKIMAPATRTNTLHDIFSVSPIELTSPFQVSLPVAAVTTSVKKTPTAPASVGVNMPAYNPPITRTNIAIASMTPVRDCIFSFRLVFGPAGPRSGFIRQRTRIVITKRVPNRMGGRIPPRKSLIMDCSVCKPIIMRTTLGGMTVPKVPPVATVPLLSLVS